jgi:hypothetical protein
LLRRRRRRKAMNVSLDPNWRTRVRRDNLSEEEEKEGEKEEVHFPCCPFNFYFCILSRCEEESVKFSTATNCYPGGAGGIINFSYLSFTTVLRYPKEQRT